MSRKDKKNVPSMKARRGEISAQFNSTADQPSGQRKIMPFMILLKGSLPPVLVVVCT